MTTIIRITQPVRGCGKRKSYGAYVVGGTEVSEEGVLARFNRITPPVPYQVKVHRSPRIVDGYAILGRQPLDEWWFGSSKKTEEKKAGDAWALETFGMTIHKRLHTGSCAGCKSPEEALSVLVQLVRWDKYILYWFRDMTRDGIQEINRAAVPYNLLHESLCAYARNRKVGNLISAQAAVWQLAYAVPPSKRSTHIPNLVRMLVSMGLVEDAKAMQYLFSQENQHGT